MSQEKKVLRDVLIIDDDLAVCEVIKTYCKNMGCFNKIVIAQDGIIASQKLANQKFSLILVDYNLPKKNGYQIVNELENSIKQAVCVVSGKLDKNIIEKFVDAGVKNFISKPFDEASFQAKVLKMLV
jgi:response regulator of citrate/malate metabolism